MHIVLPETGPIHVCKLMSPYKKIIPLLKND